MVDVFCLIILVVLGIIVILGLWRQRLPFLERLSPLALVVDRSVRIFRQHLLLLLAFTTIFAPLGIATQVLAPFALAAIWPTYSTFFEPMPFNLWIWVGRLAWIGTTLGLGHTIIDYIAATVCSTPLTKYSLQQCLSILQRNWRPILVLACLRSPMSLLLTAFQLCTFFDNGNLTSEIGFGIIIASGILGLIFQRSIQAWSLVPILMVREALTLRVALQRSTRIIKAQARPISNYWAISVLIGWLIVSGPIAISGMIMNTLFIPDNDTATRIWVVIWALGSIFVAPLLSITSAEFYLSLYAPSEQLALRVERWHTEQRMHDSQQAV